MWSRSARLALLALLLIGIVFQTIGPGSTSAASSLHFLYGSGSQTGGRRITLRVELTEPAPQGGVDVALSASNAAIQVPASVHVSTGQKTKEFTVATDPIATDTSITVSSTYAGVTKSRVVLLKAAKLKAVTVQSVIRHGATGRIMIALTGPAPTGGYTVGGDSLPAGILDFTLGSYTVPAGADRLILKVAANLMGASSDGVRLPPQIVEVRVDDGSNTWVLETTVKDFGNDPRPTSTATNTPTNTATTTETATPTDTALPTETATRTTTSTATLTPTSTTTPTPTATGTATTTPISTPTQAPLSAACGYIADGDWNSTGYVAGSIAGIAFNGGDVITLDFTGPATTVLFEYQINNGDVPVAQAISVPGSGSLTLPVAGVYWSFGWTTSPPTGVTVVASCVAGPTPTQTATATATGTATTTPISTPTQAPLSAACGYIADGDWNSTGYVAGSIAGIAFNGGDVITLDFTGPATTVLFEYQINNGDVPVAQAISVPGSGSLTLPVAGVYWSFGWTTSPPTGVTVVASCVAGPTPTQTATATATGTATTTPTETSTATPSSTLLPTGTAIPVQTATSLPTSTNTATPFNTVAPTSTSTIAPTFTNTLVPTATNTPVPTRTPSGGGGGGGCLIAC